MATPFQVLTNSFTGSVDAANDTIPYWQNSTSSAFSITRNKFLNLASAPVGLTDTQTLTNKTLTSPTISGPTLSGTVLGTYTLGGTPTFPATVILTTGAQSLASKTLTGPTISGGSIDNATMTVDTIAGHTTSNTGTIYGMSVTAGVLGSAALLNTVNAAAIQNTAITLGYAQITSNFTTTNTTSTQITGLTTSVTIPSGSRKIRVTAYCPSLTNSATPKTCQLEIWDGTVGSGTRLNYNLIFIGATGQGYGTIVQAIVAPVAGSKTYNVGVIADPGGGTTVTVSSAPTGPSFILVEAI